MPDQDLTADDEFAQYDREQAEIEAWRKLVEMHTSLKWHATMETWLCFMPTGESCERIDHPGDVMYDGDDPIELVARVHAEWVRAGRPAVPVPVEVEVGDEEPEATAHQRRPDDA